MVLFAPARPPLATLSEYPSIGESIVYQLNGLIVVFLALSSIWALTELIGLFFRQRATARSSAAAKAATSAVPAAEQAPSPELIAVIVASVSAVLDGPHRITAIAPLEEGRDWAREGRDWAREGRREIFASHKTR